MFCSVIWGTCSGWCCRPPAHLSEPTQTATSTSPNTTSASSVPSSRRASSSTAATAPADWKENASKSACYAPNHSLNQKTWCLFLPWRASENHLDGLRGSDGALFLTAVRCTEVLFQGFFHFSRKRPQNNGFTSRYNNTESQDIQSQRTLDRLEISDEDPDSGNKQFYSNYILCNVRVQYLLPGFKTSQFILWNRSAQPFGFMKWFSHLVIIKILDLTRFCQCSKTNFRALLHIWKKKNDYCIEQELIMAAILTVIYFVQPFCWDSDLAEQKALSSSPSFVPEIETLYLQFILIVVLLQLKRLL